MLLSSSWQLRRINERISVYLFCKQVRIIRTIILNKKNTIFIHSFVEHVILIYSLEYIQDLQSYNTVVSLVSLALYLSLSAVCVWCVYINALKLTQLNTIQWSFQTIMQQKWPFQWRRMAPNGAKMAPNGAKMCHLCGKKWRRRLP